MVGGSSTFAQTCNTGPCTGACVFPVNVEKGCNCFDGKDNDGNGLIDSADPTCASYYGLTFVGAGSNCSITPPSANSGFANMAAPQTSSQNTADTPSKISVGDMNGDGVPDAVVTSKWNSTIQVVATATASGFSPGNIMGDYTTPGSKIFPKAGSNYVFEHETAIADINKDGIGEMYAIASYRGGSPNNPPTEYFLTGFEYASGKGALIPLFNAVDLGSVRPGSMGIADFDGDGKAEIYLRNQIYAAESGVKLADGGGNWLTEISSGPVAVNLLGDNKLELVCGNFIYTVPSLASRTLQTLTVAKDLNSLGLGPHYYPKGYNDVNQYGHDQVSTTSTADLDADGFMDVVITGSVNCSGNEAVPCANNITTIFYWNVQKNTLATYAPSDPVYPANGWIWGTGRVNLDDANGDGKLDLVFVAGAQIFCLTPDATGATLVKQWVRTINDNPGVLSLTIYDFNNDGNPEVVYRDAQQLSVADGKTGQTTIWSTTCQAYTFTEGPIVADVNGDGSTDICITCYTSNAFNLAHDTPQQESLGQTRLYYSSTNSWLPTRQIWNQHPYYVTNITDKLTLPFPQLNPSLVFGNAPCPNGIPGPHRPFNVFMDQVPTLSAGGCPIFPAPNLTFFGDTPNPNCLTSPLPAGCDTNGDGVYSPTVVITPPICGNLGIQAQFNLTNNGNLPITDNVPVSFFNGDPTTSPTTAVRLFNTSIPITNLAVGATFTSPIYNFNGPGSAFTLFIAIYNDGSVLPLSFSSISNKDCNIADKVYSVPITPTPFTVTVSKVSDNNNCPPYNPPNTGSLQANISVGGTAVVDLSPYAFQWYTGTTTANPIAGATNYNITGLTADDYSVVVTNIQKGCQSAVVTGTVGNVNGGFPSFSITKLSDQTLCSPPNGELLAVAADGSTGYTYTWLDTNLNPIGVTGPDAKNLVTGNYILNITRGTCTYPGVRPQQYVGGPIVPNAQAETLQNVLDCNNPNTGSIQADALDASGVIQNPANYTFNWYYYNNSTSTQGSILPATYGTGQTRTGLPVGYYQAVIVDKTTLCSATLSPVTQVQSQTVIPDPPVITQVTPLTSCDPAQPNGAMIANVTVGGVPQSPNGFTFQWFKGQNTLPGNLVNTTSGTNGQQVNQVSGGGTPYTVLVSTPFHCTASAYAPVIENLNVPIITPTATPNSICNPALASSQYNGTVSASVSFAGSNVVPPSDPNYQFTWYNGATTASPTITVADNTNPVLSNLKDGSYTLVVTRTDLHCTSSASTIVVNNTTVLPALSATSTGSNNCDPALTPDGTATVAVTNMAGPFTYQWYDGNAVGTGALGAANDGTSVTAIKVGGPTGAPNPYTVLVTSTATGCQNNTTQFVADNSIIPVLSFASIVPNSICSPSTSFNGSLTAQVNNIPSGYTISDYTFKWYDGNSNAAPVDGTSTSTLLNKLDAGFYTVAAKNTLTGCQSAPITNQVPNAKIIPALGPTSTGSHNCTAGVTPDGTASVSISNIQPGDAFTYQWHVGNTTGGAALGVGNNGTAATATAIGGPIGAPNPYTVLVTNTTTGCTNFTTASVPDNSFVPILSLTPSDNSICDPAKGYNGSISSSFTDTNGAADLHTYAWSNGNTMGSIIGGATSSTLIGQNGGLFYTATITNTTLGCTSSPVTTKINNNQVLPTIAATPTPSTNCVPAGAANGSISSSVSNAVVGETFAYQWYTGNTTAVGSEVSNSPNNGNTATVVQLQGGSNYTVSVYNNVTGCSNTLTQILADNSSVPVLSLASSDNSICDPAKGYNGSISSSFTDTNGAADPHTYAWSNGNTMGSIIGGATSSTLIGQNGGLFYTATITNTTLGCTSSPVTTKINNNQVLPTIAATPTPSTNCVPAGAANGSISSSVSNAVVGETFAYQWYTGNTTAVGSEVSNSPNNGNTATVVQLQGGSNYTVSVYNSVTGCSNTLTQTLTDAKVLPTFILPTTPNTKCVPNPNYDGTATVNGLNDPNAIGGDTYSIIFYGGNSTGSPVVQNGVSIALINQNQGFVTTTVTNDRLGCTSSSVTSEILNLLTYPTITTGLANSTNCSGGTPNGSADVISVAQAGPYEYRWYSGTTVGAPGSFINGTLTTTNITGIQGGSAVDYIVQVTLTSTGCAGTSTVAIQDASQLPLITPLGFTDNVNCSGSPNGTAFVNATTPFTYRGTTISNPYSGFNLAWSTGATVDNINTLSAGTYTLQITAGAGNSITNNNDNCISNLASVTILDSLTYPVITVTETDQTSCSATPNGSLTATSTVGGVGVPINYTWYNGTGGFPNPTHAQTGANSGIINQLASGSYTVQVVTTSTGCTSTQTDNVKDNVVYPSLSVSIVNNVTVCSPTPDGSVTFSIANLSAPSKYDLYYAFTSAFSTLSYPTVPDSISNPNAGALTKRTYTNLTNQSAVPAGYGNLIPGYLTALVIDDNTGCQSNPLTQQVLDNTSQNKISILGKTQAGFCGGNGGGIQISVSGNVGATTYSWYHSPPTNTNINFFNNPPSFGTPLVTASQDLGAPTGLPLAGVDAGAYTVVVIDGNGCGAYHVDNVPFANVPVITITPSNITKCIAPFDGALKVDVLGVSATGYTIEIFRGNSPLPANSIGGPTATTITPPPLSITKNALSKGDYYIEVIDQSPANQNCPLGNQITLNELSLPPIITINQINPNTSCTPGTNADGSVKLTVADDPNDKYTASTGNPKNYEISNIVANPSSWIGPIAVGVSGTTAGPITGFKPQSYSISVMETISGCANDATVTIPDVQNVPNVLNVNIVPETMCSNSTNGSATVSLQGGEPVSDFDFTWSKNNDLSTPDINLSPGGGGTNGELINQAKDPTWPMGVTAGLGNGDRTFYVQGIKNASSVTGVGCPTQVVQVVIPDQHVSPTMSLSSLPNTSCDPLVGEGSISITASTASGNPFVSGANYNYILDPLGTPVPVNNQPGTTSTPFNAVLDGTWTIRATNVANGCKVENNNTVGSTKFALSITNFTTQDKFMCNPDGSINVIEVAIDRTITGQSTLTYTAAVPTVSNNFDFRWFSGSPGTFTTGTPLSDGVGPTVISTQTLAAGSGVGQYSAMGAGTYYVVARRKSPPSGDAPIVGAGCETPAIQININDKHVNPVVTLVPSSDTSCAGIFEGGIGVTISDASVTIPPSTPYNFNYGWMSTSSTTPVVAPSYPVGTSSFLALQNGDYSLTATNNQTGCAVTANTTIIKNLTPIFVTNFKVTPQFYCNPSGNILITDISYTNSKTGVTESVSGGNFPITNFNFNWNRSGVGAVGSTTQSLDSSAANYPGIGAAMYSVTATRATGSPGNGCISAPITITISDKSMYPKITLTPFSNTSCIAASEGEIQVNVTDASVAKVPAVSMNNFDYTWMASPNPIASSPSLGNNGNMINDGPGPDHDDEIGLQEGGYTLQVTSAVTGCISTASTTILKNTTPVFITKNTVVPKFYCNPSGNTVITQVQYIDRTGATITPAIGEFSFTWTQPGGGAVPGPVTTPNLDSLNFPGIAPGVYQVFATRSPGFSPGAGCSSAPSNIEIKDKSVLPVITLTPFSNTSCSGVFEGAIQVDVADASVAKKSPPALIAGPPWSYQYTWTDPLGAGLVLPTPNPDPAKNGIANLYQNLQDGTYQVSVQNNITTCLMTATTVIIKNATPVFTQLVTPTNQVLCGPDGKLVVNEVRVVDRNGNVKSSLSDFPISDFVFTYDQNAIGNAVLGPNSTATQLDNANFPTIGAATYFVTATRQTGTPGSGCSSSPYKVDILNKQIFPVVSLTPLANTSCDPSFFEGEIQVNVSDGSVNLPAPLAGAPFLYNYTWTASASAVTLPAGTITLNNNGNGSSTDGDRDNPTGLKEGAYTVSVTNNQTSCVSTGTTTIFRNSTPVFTQSVVPTNQILCNPDGSLLVQEVKVIDRNGNTEVFNSGSTPNISDFVFTYSRNTIGNTVLGPNSPLLQLDKTDYPAIGFDIYYVVATRQTGSPGLGCASAPYEVQILDKRLFPQVSFTAIENSSCNSAKPNGSVTASASEQNGTNTDPYTFAWTLNANPIGPLAPNPTQTNTSPQSVITNAVDGTYVVTATNTNTGCPLDASFNLQLDQTRSIPNIIDVSTINPVDCNPSASATVTKITLGSTFNSITQPPNAAGNNAITGAALTGFTFTWASGLPASVIGGQTAPVINNIAAGTYFVSVTDPSTDCQSGPKEVDISKINVIYPVVNIAQPVKQISCLAALGTSVLVATANEQDNTIGNYNFTWYPSLDLSGTAIAGSTTVNPNTISNLFDGNYSVLVQNTVTSCVASALFVVPNDAPEFAPIISATSTPLNKCVGFDGDAQVRILINPSYPLQPFNYTADMYFGANPNLSLPPSIANIPAIPGSYTYDYPILNMGYYTYRITDNKTGCIDTAGVRVGDNRIKPVVVVEQDNPLTRCPPFTASTAANGQLSATADGKIQGYSFEWFAGSTVPTPPASPFPADNKLIGVNMGTYVVRGTSNTTSCFADQTGTIVDGTVKPPVPTAIVVANRTNCITPNGEVSANVGGAIFNYSFDWFDGSAVKNSPDNLGPDYAGLDIGPYTVTATDQSTGCVSPPATVTVFDKRVTPVFDLSSTPSFCSDTGKPNGNGTALLALKIQGMVLSDIQWTDVTNNVPAGVGPEIFQLWPGVYKVQATSTDGCEADGMVTIGTEISPYNGISSNGDGKNDNFIIDCITNFPDNNVKIFNRTGIKVYEANGYNNADISFRGIGEQGLYFGSNSLPIGTYFYIIDKRDGTKPVAGYLELTR